MRIGEFLMAGLLGVAALAGVGVARAAELETFQYGRWTGTANTDDSGSFSRCAVTGRFKRASVTSGREVAAAIALDRINGWTLGFAGGDTGASPVSFRITIDGEAVIEGQPEAQADQVAVIGVPDIERFLGALRRGSTLGVAAADEHYDLALAGVARALDWVEACAKRYANFVPPGREKATADAAKLRQDIAGLMGRLLQAVEAKEVRVGPPPGIPAYPSEDKSLSWKADGMQGEIQVWAGKNAQSLADRIIGTSPGCRKRAGEVKKAPAARPPAGPKKAGKPDPIVFEVVDCDDPGGTRRIALVLMPRSQGGIYLISVQTREPGAPDKVDRLGERLVEEVRRTVLR